MNTRSRTLPTLIRTALAAALLSVGSNARDSEPSPQKSLVRGGTEKEAKLTFLCDDGGRYSALSRGYGITPPRFSLTLPRNALCRVLITPRGSSFPSMVYFRDHRDNRSPLIYLKSARIDLGTIRDLSARPYATLTRDDAMLAVVKKAASPEKDDLRLGKADRIYQLKKI